MPDEYKVESVIDSYRNYYIGVKKDFCVWKNRETPSWFKSEKNLVNTILISNFAL